MLRLFITLYLAVFASFILFLFALNGLDLFDSTISESVSIQKKLASGTLTLVEEELAKRDGKEKNAFLEQYKKRFGPEFGLLDSSSLKDQLDEDDLKKLKKGDIIYLDINQYIHPDKSGKEAIQKTPENISLVYLKQKDTNKIWQINIDIQNDLTINEEGVHSLIHGGKFSDGMMMLIQSRLSDSPNNKSAAIKDIQKKFQMPIDLINKEKAFQQAEQLLKKPITETSKKNIFEGKVVNITQESDYATLVKKLPESEQLIRLGPVEIPWFTRNFPYLMLIAFALSFATMLFLWIKPLWSNLITIKQAAEDFGEGNYDKRIRYGRFSPIKHVSMAFNSMAERTQRSMRAQKELTSAVSHELRTPVSRMRFALSILDSSNDPKDKKRFIKAINEDIDELDMLLEELLSYARLDQSEPQLTPVIVKIKPWFNNSMKKLLPLANDKLLHYNIKNIEKQDNSLFEPKLMSRMLNNLVQNALRYADSTVDVTFKKEQGYLFILVEDDGKGIPKDKQETIFNPFSRLDPSRDRASGGFGLGLAIVNQIVKAHQGIITIHESPLGGAKFVVRIPYQPQQTTSSNTTKE